VTEAEPFLAEGREAFAAGDAARAVVAGGAALVDAQPLLAPWAAMGLLPGRTPCQTR
jgi:hypothetical protein